MSQKAYKYILQTGVYASLFIVFFVFKGLLFPYITSKQIPFNILIEVLGIFWVAFIIKYPEWRPRWNYISFALLTYLIAMVVSSIVGVDFNLSFWGDVERMLGVFHIAHFFLLYFIIITVMREWSDWKPFFIISLIASLFVAFKSFGDVPHSTIGNTIYVAGYMIFNMYFAALLFIKEKNIAIKPLYLLVIPIYLASFNKAGSAGGMVGIAASVLFVLFVYGVLNKNKKIKTITLSTSFILLATFAYMFVINRDNYLSRNVKFINYVTEEISFEKNTFKTRLISWKAGLKDLKEHPILGTGHGNFAVSFDKYFTANFYDFTRSETYFDRAHNNLVDIVSTTGIVGLLTYLSIFFAVAYYLIMAYRHDKISVHEFAVISGLIVAYFIQNLAAFDSFVTYIALMMILGYVYWRFQGEREVEINEESGSEMYLVAAGALVLPALFYLGDKVNFSWIMFISFAVLVIVYFVYNKATLNPKNDKGLGNDEIFAIIVTGIVSITILYQYNVLPLKMLLGTIDGQIAYSQKGLVEAIDVYRTALSYNSVLDRDSRTSMNRLLISNPGSLRSLPNDKAESILQFSLEHAEANVAYNESDSLNQMMLAQLYNVASQFYSGSDAGKSEMYSNLALETIEKSIAASPERVPIYFQKTQMYITRGEKDNAIKTLEYALSLNDKYFDSYCNLAKTHFYFQEEEVGYKYMDTCIDLNGFELLQPADYVKGLINHYVEAGDDKRVFALYKYLVVRLEPNVADNWIKLSKMYEQNKEFEQAIAAAQKAGELNKEYAASSQRYIEGLKAQYGIE